MCFNVVWFLNVELLIHRISLLALTNYPMFLFHLLSEFVIHLRVA